MLKIETLTTKRRSYFHISEAARTLFYFFIPLSHSHIIRNIKLGFMYNSD